MKAEGHDHASEPGAGAAGGLGYGLQTFLGGRLEPGFEVFARYAGLAKRLRAADLVITGEGAIDRQTLMGKGVGQLAEWCRGRRVPCVALAGAASARDGHGLFTSVHSLTELASVDQAMSRPAHWLQRLAKRVSRISAPTAYPEVAQEKRPGNFPGDALWKIMWSDIILEGAEEYRRHVSADAAREGSGTVGG